MAIALAALIGLLSHANLPTTISLVIYAQEKKIIKTLKPAKQLVFTFLVAVKEFCPMAWNFKTITKFRWRKKTLYFTSL